MIIYRAVDFLTSGLNQYLRIKFDSPVADFAVAGNVSALQDATGAGAASLNDRIIVSLINVEEDRISKNPENMVRMQTGMIFKNPKVFLNLYILFAAHRHTYRESLISLSFVVQFFQYHNVFNRNNSPGMFAQIEKMIPDLVTLNFEQMNQVWSILGGKYIPSVLYKIRLVSIDEGIMEGEGEFIRDITVDAKTYFPDPR
jgi:hypothetical protein